MIIAIIEIAATAYSIIITIRNELLVHEIENVNHLQINKKNIYILNNRIYIISNRKTS
jgi:hypothetical protein